MTSPPRLLVELVPLLTRNSTASATVKFPPVQPVLHQKNDSPQIWQNLVTATTSTETNTEPLAETTTTTTTTTTTAMFSWSNNSSSASRTSSYPAQRRPQQSSTGTTGSSSPFIAQPIQGSIRPPEFSRAQHIESYLGDSVLKRSTRKISRDDTTYDTVFQTTKGDTLIVRIHLPPSSGPTCKAPVMTLAGVTATHPWLDSRMRITGYKPILTDDSWRSKRMLLGPAVHEVVKHLQLNPPTVIEITDDGLRAIQPSGGSSSNHSNNGASPSQQQQQGASNGHHHHQEDAPPDYATLQNNNNNMDVQSIPDIDLPTIPSKFDAVDSLSREEIETILEDEIQFMAFANKLPFMEEVLKVRCSVLDENVKMAEESLAKEQHLQNLHQQVTTLKKELQSALVEFQTLEKQQDELCAPPDKRKVLKDLSKAKKQALDQSERMAEEWLDDGGNVDDFVRNFVNLRMTHHVRAAKMELLQQDNLL